MPAKVEKVTRGEAQKRVQDGVASLTKTLNGLRWNGTGGDKQAQAYTKALDAIEVAELLALKAAGMEE